LGEFADEMSVEIAKSKVFNASFAKFAFGRFEVEVVFAESEGRVWGGFLLSLENRPSYALKVWRV